MKSDRDTSIFACIIVFAIGCGIAEAENKDYNGPNLETRVVSTNIGSVSFRFPRNYIISNFNGLRLGLDLSLRSGVSSENILLFERWSGGTAQTPSLVEVEITSGSPSVSISEYRKTLGPDSLIGVSYGLQEYRFTSDSSHYLPTSGDPSLIFCNKAVYVCDLTFGIDHDLGVLIKFSLARISDWRAIKSFAIDIVEKHEVL